MASEAFAAGMDAQDELAHLRQKFWIPKVKNLPDCKFLSNTHLILFKVIRRAKMIAFTFVEILWVHFHARTFLLQASNLAKHKCW